MVGAWWPEAAFVRSERGLATNSDCQQSRTKQKCEVWQNSHCNSTFINNRSRHSFENKSTAVFCNDPEFSLYVSDRISLTPFFFSFTERDRCGENVAEVLDFRCTIKLCVMTVHDCMMTFYD